MTVVLAVTANPQNFSGNTYPGAAFAMNSGIWRFTFTPTAASTTYTGGNFHALFGQPLGACWLNDSSLELYTTPGDALVFSQLLTWLAATPITVTINTRPGAGTVTIAGALTGNGTFSFTPQGPYIDPTLTLGIGQDGNNFAFVGSINAVDDTAPDMSWTPAIPTSATRRASSSAALVAALTFPILVAPVTPAPAMSWSPVVPAHQLRPAPRAPNVGGMFAPDAVLANASAPLESWLPCFPDRLVIPLPAVNQGGATQPVAVLPNAAAPAMSWAPEFPDFAPGPRRVVNVGGMAHPEAVIANAAAPTFSWTPVIPDLIQRPRPAPLAGETAPPFAGGPRLTVGTAAIRQCIENQLAFSTPLTTFGTDLTFTANSTTDVLTTATHGMVVCAGPFTLSTTGTLPAGLDAVTLYYVANPTTTTFQLALTATLARAGTVVGFADAGTGTHTLNRVSNSAPLYSTFIAIFARGDQAGSPNQATDNKGNTYSYVSGLPRAYDGFPGSSLSISTVTHAVGGLAHTWSASVTNVGGNQDETTIGGLEIFDAPILQSSSILERVNGGPAIISSGTVTTTAKALLVAIIAGNSNVNQDNTWTFLDGFTKVARICAEGDLDPAGYIQIEVAVRLVDLKGTYSFRAAGQTGNDGPSGGQLALIAFQAVTSDLQPLDWLFPQADPPRAARRGLPGGEVAPPVQSQAPVVTPLSWAPSFPDPIRARGRAPIPSVAEPIGQPVPPQWWPIVPDAVSSRGRRQLAGETAPPTVATALLSWLPTVIAPRAARGAQLAGETAPPVIVQPLPTWLPVYPSTLNRPTLRIQGGIEEPVIVIPNAAVPLMTTWSPLPAGAPLVRLRSAAPGGAIAPVLTIPNAPAPPQWWPIVPTAPLARARQPQVGGQEAPFTAALVLAPPLVKLAPVVSAVAPDLLQVTVEIDEPLTVTADI